MSKAVIVFFIITLINVILSTVKSILTVRASRTTASIINAISYGFYTIVVRQMSEVSAFSAVTVTIACNLIGVNLAMLILEKFKKDTLWKITVLPVEADLKEIKRRLVDLDIGYNEIEMVTKYGNQAVLDIFSKTSEESKQIRNILDKNEKVKYHIVELDKSL